MGRRHPHPGGAAAVDRLAHLKPAPRSRGRRGAATRGGSATPAITIAAVGRLRAGPTRSLIDDYLGRIGWRVVEHEVEVPGHPPTAERKAREAELLLAAVPPGGLLVSLDPAGASLTSEDFAQRLGRCLDQARPVAFAIGGADGHGEAVTLAADWRLALGPMTWPHALARAMLAEQLWRAYAIHTRHPYHRLD